MKIWWISCWDNEDFMRKKKKRKRKSPFDFTSLQMNLMVLVLDWSGFFTRSKKKKKRKRKKISFDFNLVMNLMVGFSWGYTRTTMLINMLAIFKNCLLLWHLSIQEPNQSLNLSFGFHPLVALHCTGLQFLKKNSSSVLCLLVIMTCPAIIVFSSTCKSFWNCIFFVEQFSKHSQCSWIFGITFLQRHFFSSYPYGHLIYSPFTWSVCTDDNHHVSPQSSSVSILCKRWQLNARNNALCVRNLSIVC